MSRDPESRVTISLGEDCKGPKSVSVEGYRDYETSQEKKQESVDEGKDLGKVYQNYSLVN